MGGDPGAPSWLGPGDLAGPPLPSLWSTDSQNECSDPEPSASLNPRAVSHRVPLSLCQSALANQTPLPRKRWRRKKIGRKAGVWGKRRRNGNRVSLSYKFLPRDFATFRNKNVYLIERKERKDIEKESPKNRVFACPEWAFSRKARAQGSVWHWGPWSPVASGLLLSGWEWPLTWISRSRQSGGSSL